MAIQSVEQLKNLASPNQLCLITYLAGSNLGKKCPTMMLKRRNCVGFWLVVQRLDMQDQGRRYWLTSFQNRHPHLSLRAPSRFAYARAVANDPDVFEAYFDLLEETLSQNNLLDKPNSICDESGFSLDPKIGKLVGLKRVKEFNVITFGDKSQLFVDLGTLIPPFIIFDVKAGEMSGTLCMAFLQKDGLILNYLKSGSHIISCCMSHQFDLCYYCLMDTRPIISPVWFRRQLKMG